MAVFVWGLVSIIIFYVAILVVGLVAGRRSKHSEKNANSSEVMLAGRNIGMVIGFFTMTATWVGGGFINGSAEIVYLAKIPGEGGLVWAQAPVGFSISLVLGGIFYAKKMRKNHYVTMIDPIQERIGDRMGALLVLVAICGELFWSASILSALGSTLSVIINLELWISIIISAAIALLYTVLGGLYSVVYTDVVQLFCILFGLVLAVPFAYNNEAVTPLTETAYLDTPKGGWKGYLEGYSWGLFIDFYLLIIFGGIPWQVYFQRVLSAKTARGAQVLSILAGCACLIMAIPPVLIGAIGFSTDWNQTSYADTYNSNNQTIDGRLILSLVLKHLTPVPVAVIGLGAVAAAVMSSADSSMLSSSTMVARNVWTMVFRPKASEIEIVWVMRITAMVCCVIATLMAIFVTSIYGLFVLCSDFVYVCLFYQLTFCLYVPWYNTYGAFCGFWVSLILRLLAGEYYYEWAATLVWPWYEPESKLQNFPHRTISMLIGGSMALLISYLFKWLFESGRLHSSYDRWNAVVQERDCNLIRSLEAAARERAARERAALDGQSMELDGVANTGFNDIGASKKL